MKHKSSVIAISVVVVAIITFVLPLALAMYGWISGNCFGIGDKTEIKDGFSDSLVSKLNSQYGITIPENADFIKGMRTTPSFQDTYLVLLFSIPINSQSDSINHVSNLKSILKMDSWNGGSCDELDTFPDYGGNMPYEFTRSNDPFSYLRFRIEGDRYVVRFVGYHPY